MPCLIALLQCGDSDTVCNALWALKSLVSEGKYRDLGVRRQTAGELKALFGSPDKRVASHAKALAETLTRPCPIDTTTVDDEAAAGLLGILHTPPPSQMSRPTLELETQGRKRKAHLVVEEQGGRSAR